MSIEEWSSARVGTMQLIRTVVGVLKLIVALYVVGWVF